MSGPIVQYEAFDVGYPYVIRGTNQQTDVGLIFQPPTYKAYGAGAVAAQTFSAGGIRIGGASLHNRGGGAAPVGIGVRIPNMYWKAGQWTDATTTYVDDTTDAQDAGSDDFALETTTNNDGFVILSRIKFNAISFDVTTASSGGTPARAVRFATAAGTGWQSAESNLFVHNVSSGNYATGENVIVWSPPVDWGLSSSLATDLPNGYYAVNVRATTAPSSTAGLARAIELFRIYFPTEGLADNGVYEAFFGSSEFTMPPEGDGLVALFGTANDQNRVTGLVRSAG